MKSTMPIVLKSVGDQGQRVEHGFAWPENSATTELINAYRVLLGAEQSLESSRRRGAGEARTVREMLAREAGR